MLPSPDLLSPLLVFDSQLEMSGVVEKEGMERSSEDLGREEISGKEEEDAMERLQEACGVVGCVLARNTPDGAVNVAKMIYLGLVALQHR